VAARFIGPLARRLAGGKELTQGPSREPLGRDAAEDLVRRSELDAGVDAAVLTTEPLAVQELSASEMGGASAAAEKLDRLLVKAFGVVTLGKECCRPRPHAERPVGAADACPGFELPEGL
jgi:hypothetical protein